MLWLAFAACTAAILYCGFRLSKYGDVIAEKSGMGRTWIGLVLMATVTSLPELVNGASSVLIAHAPDIAVGDVLGSCVFNLLILAFLDASVRTEPLSTRARQGNIISAGFGVVLLCIVLMGIVLRDLQSPTDWIGYYSIVILACYLVAERIIFKYERKQIDDLLKAQAQELLYKDISVKQAVWNYVFNAGAVVVAATFLPNIGVAIAEETGLGNTFVGSVFIALSTSLPEMVVSGSAMKIGAIDLAVGNLFGSNVFNIMILAVDDMLFTQGPILAHTSSSHAVTAISAIAMSAVAMIGLMYRASRKPLPMAWDSMAMTLIFGMNMVILFLLR